MKYGVLLAGLVSSLVMSAFGQQRSPVTTPETGNSPVLSGRPVGGSAGCIASFKRISFKRQPLPAAIRPLVPKAGFVRLVLNLSTTDTLAIYEMQNREIDPYSIFPDTRLLITRDGQPVYRLAIKDVSMNHGPTWGKDAVAMNVAQMCSADSSLTYLVVCLIQIVDYRGWPALG